MTTTTHLVIAGVFYSLGHIIGRISARYSRQSEPVNLTSAIVWRLRK